MLDARPGLWRLLKRVLHRARARRGPPQPQLKKVIALPRKRVGPNATGGRHLGWKVVRGGNVQPKKRALARRPRKPVEPLHARPLRARPLYRAQSPSKIVPLRNLSTRHKQSMPRATIAATRHDRCRLFIMLLRARPAHHWMGGACWGLLTLRPLIKNANRWYSFRCRSYWCSGNYLTTVRLSCNS